MSELDDFSSPATATSQPPSDLDSISSPMRGPTPQQRAVVGANDNPEEASKALAISKKTSIPPSIVQTDLPGYTAHMNRQQAIQHISDNPFIAKYIDDNPLAASVSSDDYPNLAESSKAVQALHPATIRSNSFMSAIMATKPADDDHGFIAETSRSANSALAKIGALSGRGEMGPLEGLLATGRAAAAVPEYLTSGLTGAIRSFGGRAINALDMLIRAPAAQMYGEDRVPKPTFEQSASLAEKMAMVAPVIGFAPRLKIANVPDIAGVVSSTEDLAAAARGAQTRSEIDAFIKSKEAQTAHAEAGGAALDNAVEVAQQSTTKQRSPDLYAASVEAHEPGNVHIDGQKLMELYSKEGKVPAEGDGLFGFVSDLAQKIENAAATGGEVTIPVSQYLAHVDPAVHEGLKDSVRLHEDGVTREEAKALAEEKPPTNEAEQDKAFGSLPKLAEGMVRFYHGGLEPTTGGPRWVTPYFEYARDFRRGEEPNQVHYVDIPLDELKANADQGYSSGFDEINNRLVNFEAPEQYAKQLKPVLEQKPQVPKARDNEPEQEKKPSAAAPPAPVQEGPVGEVQTEVNAARDALGLRPQVFMDLMFQGGKSVGITEPEFKAYSEKVANAEKDILDRAVAEHRAEIARTLTPEWKRNEARVRDEVTRDFQERGVFAAERFLRQKNIELKGDNLDAIADDLAPIWGFQDGNALRRALDELEFEKARSNRSVQAQLRDAIKEETAARMEAKYGSLAENIAKEARQIALSNHVFDVLADEVRLLANANSSPPPLSRAEMVSGARASFERSTVSDAANWNKLQRAAERSGRETEKALLKGDFEEAFKAKQRQFLAAVQAKESLALGNIIDAASKKIDRFSSEQVIKGMDQEHLEQIRRILDSVGIQQNIGPSMDLGSLRDFVANSEGQLAVAPWLMEGRVPQVQDMTVEQFRGFVNSLKSIEHVGRQVMKLENARGEAELQNVIVDIRKEVERFPFVDQPNHPSLPQRASGVYRKVIGSHLLVERVLDYTDQFNPHGPLTEWLDRPLRDANMKEIQLTEDVVRLLKPLKEYVDGSLNDPIENNLIPDANDKTGFLRMTRHELRTLMLNMGNWSNIKKLAEGFGVSEMDLRRMVDKNATAKDVAWVNGIWKVFEHLKPEADAVQLKDTGVPVDHIPAVPWEIGAGKLNGGYYPLSYDPYNSDILGHIAQPLFDKGYYTASTPHGYTQERTGYSGAIDLTGAHLHGKIQGMVHDIAFREAVRNANKLISNQEFRTLMAQRWGKEVSDLFPGWLRDIANSHNFSDDYSRGFARAMGLVRQNVVSTLIAYNPGTFIKHGFTALVMSLDRVGLMNLGKAMVEIGVSGSLKNLTELISKSDRLPDEAFMDAFRDSIDQGLRGENARQFILDASAVMRNRQMQVGDSIRGAVDAINQIGVAKTLADFRARQIQYGRMAVAFSDQMSAMPTWLAAYKKAYLAGESHDDAVFIADKEVSRAHGSSFIGDKPAISRIGQGAPQEIAKWFTGLFNFWGHQLNNNIQLAWDSAAYLRGPAQGMTQEPGANAASIMRRVALVMGIIAIEELATAPKDDHGHGFLTGTALATLRYFGSGFIGLRELTNGLAGGYEPSTGMIGTLFKGINESVQDLKKATGAKAGSAKNWIMHTTTTLGFLTGVGGQQVGRTGQFLHDVATGQDRPQNLTDIRQGLRTGHSKARKFK